MAFDPYWEWLQIPLDRRPPSPHDLLGLPHGETDEGRIGRAAVERYERVRPYATASDRSQAEHAHRILEELAQAHVALVRSGKPEGRGGPQPQEASRVGEGPIPRPVVSATPIERAVQKPASSPEKPAPGARRPASSRRTAASIPGPPVQASGRAVWGIEVGNAALKAIRCRAAEGTNQIVADAFDYLEYPKILTQPDAAPEAIVGDAVRQFQARNDVRGDRLAMSVPGQNGLARFFLLPSVETKRVPEIVKFEARQQIPFPLEDVAWDYQQIAGAATDGFVLEAEVGLFAMKRDQLSRALAPLRSAGITTDFVQLAPLAVYNFLVFDQLDDLPSAEEYDPNNPPPSKVVLSMGTDATDLMITDGRRIWQRSIPLGGNHFSRQLTKELRLTFAKAEHLKRNVASSEDPKAAFQAMRPVFNDLVTEVQRSIGFYMNIYRAAQVDKLFLLGNAMKLPGLPRYLGANLGYETGRVDSFRRLVGAHVLNATAFRDNALTFAPCYGLALQALGRSVLKTNLLPVEWRRLTSRVGAFVSRLIRGA